MAGLKFRYEFRTILPRISPRNGLRWRKRRTLRTALEAGATPAWIKAIWRRMFDPNAVFLLTIAGNRA